MIQLKNADFVALFQNVPENALPVFGKMSPRQLTNHLLMALNLSLGEIAVPAINTPEKEEKVKRVILGNDRPFPKGLVLPGLEEATQSIGLLAYKDSLDALNSMRDIFYQYYSLNPELKQRHPAMGMLNFQEWELFHFKHFTHHLSQYELIL